MNIQINYHFYFLIIFISGLFAVLAPPDQYNVKQINGINIPVRMYGDEHYNWIETLDGYVIDFVDDGEKSGWFYCNLGDSGNYEASSILVSYPAPKDLSIKKYLREIFPDKTRIQRAIKPNLEVHEHKRSRSMNDKIFKPIIFLVDFDEIPFGFPDRIYNKDQFHDLFFKNNLDPSLNDLPSNYNMSVSDYFNQISNEKLLISGTSNSVVDWVTANNSYSHYVDGKQGTGLGPNGISNSAAGLVVEIALKVHSDVDFSEFDGDNNGDVDLVILVVEGWGEGANSQFWPHMSIIQAGPNGIDAINPNAPVNNAGFFTLDGKAIKKYIVIPEQYHIDGYGSFKNYIHPIGTICHEIGHALGLPDLYDTTQKSGGVGKWCLMGSGNYQNTNSPAYMSAWSRYRLGYINPVIIENVFNFEEVILPAELNSVDYTSLLLPLDNHLPQEYILLENRQKIGSDIYLEKSGLLVWHIDENITDIYPLMNSVNANINNYGVKLIEADGDFDLLNECNPPNCGDSGDPFQVNSHLDGIFTNDYDRDADGIIDYGNNSDINIEVLDIDDNNLEVKITNPNYLGEIIGYNEGNYGPFAFSDYDENYDWVGIKFMVEDSSLLSGINTIIPSDSEFSFVDDYTVNIWEGWSENNMPENLLCSISNSISWTEDRNGGWIYIPFVSENIILNPLSTYYVEIDYNGSELINTFDYYAYSKNEISGFSYHRSNANTACQKFNYGDWNIRVVVSGKKDLNQLDYDVEHLPLRHLIYTNYPNPFNPKTKVPYYLSEISNVKYKIYDMIGSVISNGKLLNMKPGYHELNLSMDGIASGVYFYQFEINGNKYPAKKMLLLK